METQKKYELTNETIKCGGRTLYRIRALKDFGNVKAGELGGFVESENNLSHEGKVWISGNAAVSGSAEVTSARHYLCIGPIGSRGETITFFRTADNEMSVQSWFFHGTIGEFLEQEAKTHEDHEYAVAYRTAAELAKACIKLESESLGVADRV